MPTQAIWHGTLDESYQLTAAILHNCVCPQRCDAHQAMLEQRFIDGVLFARWLRERLLAEEWRHRRVKTNHA